MNERRTRSNVRKGSAYLWLNMRSIEDSRLAVVKITDKRDDVNLYCTRWVKQNGIEQVSVTNGVIPEYITKLNDFTTYF